MTGFSGRLLVLPFQLAKLSDTKQYIGHRSWNPILILKLIKTGLRRHWCSAFDHHFTSANFQFLCFHIITLLIAVRMTIL